MASDPLSYLPTGEPASRRDRWRATIYIAALGSLCTLVVLAVVFGRLAARGVLLIAFLSFVLMYLIAPAVERVRRMTASRRKGRPVSRSLSVLALYGAAAVVILPVWTMAGDRIETASGRITDMIPEQTTRFIEQLRASERWTERAGLPGRIGTVAGSVTRRVSQNLQAEVRELGAELAGIRRLVPWLSVVPVVAFVLLTRWSRFRRSTTRVLPTPHLQWRGDEFLRHVNSLLAAYTRAQVTSGIIVGTMCWIGFALLGLPYPGTLGFVAGVLELMPLAGPIVAAVIATAMDPDRVFPVLGFLAALRVLQDYVIYPRLISQAMRLHPLAVILALWLGAALGGLIGVCLAIPVVGVVQVAYRHWREYREIESLVEDIIRANQS